MKKTILLYFFLIISNNFAQKSIDFEFDYARFKIDSTKSYLEIYYSLGQETLIKYESEGSSFIGAYFTVSIINTNTKEVLLDKNYKVETPLNDSTNSINGDKNLVGNIAYVIPGGRYVLTISASDVADTTKSKVYEEIIEIKLFGNSKYMISDIQLATRIITESKNKNSIFYKNTMEIFPNPVNVYAESMPVLFFYSELYNLKNDPSSGNIALIKQLQNNYGEVIYSKEKTASRKNNSVCEVGVINLRKYPTGVYTLSLSLIDKSTNQGVSSSKRFYFINPSVVDTFTSRFANLSVMGSEFGILSEEECDEMFLTCRAIALGDEIDQYEELKTVEPKREFLFNFWKRRDQSPESPQNEFKIEYLERVKIVEAKYKTFNNRGVKTDRGRIYLIYDEPDEIEYHPNDYDKRPYEIWFYHGIEGGILFVFGDITGYNAYELLHSTKRGEMRDENWVRRISVN